ncbi:MAG: hypothetical protein ABI609_14140 [Acidobacteriota bacterium]
MSNALFSRGARAARIAISTLLLAGLATLAIASDKASIKIVSPKDHEQLEADETYQLEYEVDPGPGGDHFHVWVDQDRGPGIHDQKGKYTLPKMAPGEHVITLKVVDKGHVPTGPEQSIHVVVK